MPCAGLAWLGAVGGEEGTSDLRAATASAGPGCLVRARRCVLSGVNLGEINPEWCLVETFSCWMVELVRRRQITEKHVSLG